MTDVVAESAERQWPPTPPAWIDDRASQRCTGRSCHVVFDGLVERRHHCRFCGNLFCHRCSARKAMLPPQWAIKEPQRTCDTCYSILAPEQEGWIKGNANAERENFLEDDSTTKYLNSPLRFTLGGEIRKASYAIQNLTDRDNVNYWGRDAEYATEMLEAVEGLLFMTVGKVAFIGGVRVGTGLVLAKLPDGTWSAPCAVGNFGVTFGACVGAEVTDMVTGIDRETMEKFANESVSNVMVGGEASVALGLLGRSATGEAYLAASGRRLGGAQRATRIVEAATRASRSTRARRCARTSTSSTAQGRARATSWAAGWTAAGREPHAALDRFYATVFPQRQGHGDGLRSADGAPPRTFAGGTGYVADGPRTATAAGVGRGRPPLRRVRAAHPRVRRAAGAAPSAARAAGRPRTARGSRPARRHRRQGQAGRGQAGGPSARRRVVAARRSPSASGPLLSPCRLHGSTEGPPPPVVSAVRASQPAVDAAARAERRAPPADRGGARDGAAR